MEAADFSGYATKAGLKCSDGRIIMKGAFAHQDKTMVPLVWQHGHSSPSNVLGHALLEEREDGVYTYGYFNDTEHGKAAKQLVEHGDVTFLSIYANQLVEKAKQVMHGAIREVSLVLAGANPGAKIDFVAVQHSDGSMDDLDDEAVIYTGLTLEHAAKTYTTQSSSTTKTIVDGVVQSTRSSSSEATETVEEPDSQSPLAMHSDEKTVQEVYDSLDAEQKELVHFMIGEAVSGDDSAGSFEHASGRTVQDVYDSLTSEQKDVVHYMIGAALESKAGIQHSDVNPDVDANADTNSDAADQDGDKPDEDSASESDNEGDVAHQEGTTMTRNLFEQNGTGSTISGPTLSHSDMVGILESAQKSGSFKEAASEYALAHSIDNLELLFPDAKTLTTTPEMISRRVEWVAKVLDGTKHSPFAKVKTLAADVTAEEARAKGYVKGNQKVEEVLTLLRRTTGPATIYKLQAMDRDDILDITDLDIVNWLWAEMRLMIEEEVARAILVGDGRSTLSPDKVKDPAGSVDGTGIRSILHDADLFSVKTELAANVSAKDAVKGLVRARSKYRGSGKPTLFISDDFLTDLMLEEDKFGRALYETEQALVDKLRVAEIVTVDLFSEYDNLFAIMVSLADYTIGSNRGGELTKFDDFDINFNKYQYLQETRLSGGLTKPFSAVVVSRGEGTLATATAPSFNGTTDDITIPTATGVNYLIDDAIVTGTVHITGPTEVVAEPDDGYYLASNTTRSWTYTV